MKLLKAYVRTFMADGVINALQELKAPRISVIDVKALGDEDSTRSACDIGRVELYIHHNGEDRAYLYR